MLRLAETRLYVSYGDNPKVPFRKFVSQRVDLDDKTKKTLEIQKKAANANKGMQKIVDELEGIKKALEIKSGDKDLEKSKATLEAKERENRKVIESAPNSMEKMAKELNTLEQTVGPASVISN